jgi:hypothetical protein
MARRSSSRKRRKSSRRKAPKRRKSTRRKTSRRTVRASTRRSAKKVARRKSSKRKAKLGETLIGGAVVALGEPFVNQLSGSLGFPMADEVVKIGGGLWLANNQRGAVSTAGQALALIGARNLVDKAVSGGLGNIFGGSSSGSTSSSSGMTVI